MTTDPDWDPEAFTRLRKLGGDVLLGKMIRLFLENAPKRLAAALDGERQGDADAVRRAMHSLKSSAGNLGARRLEELAERVELLPGGAAVAEMSPLLRELEEVFARVRARLEQHQGAAP